MLVQSARPASRFTEQSGERTWAAEHVIGIAQGVEDIIEDLRANFMGECTGYVSCNTRLLTGKAIQRLVFITRQLMRKLSMFAELLEKL